MMSSQKKAKIIFPSKATISEHTVRTYRIALAYSYHPTWPIKIKSLYGKFFYLTSYLHKIGHRLFFKKVLQSPNNLFRSNHYIIYLVATEILSDQNQDKGLFILSFVSRNESFKGIIDLVRQTKQQLTQFSLVFFIYIRYSFSIKYSLETRIF